MKKIFLMIAIAIFIAAGKKDVQSMDYVTLSGKITNMSSDSLIIAKSKILKKIKVNSDGTFSDTLKITEGSYILFDRKAKTRVYLKNGYDLKLTVDAKQFDETIKYKGQGEAPNNYFAERQRLEMKRFPSNALAASRPEFESNIKGLNEELSSLLAGTKDLPPAFVEDQKKEFQSMIKVTNSMYEEKQKLLVLTGKESPKFKDYESIAGANVSLDDLKGKYVYIDLWATWCGPCRAEFPFLKEIESKYHGRKIAFVSISIDRMQDLEKWKKMVAKEQLSGMQLFAKGDQTFTKEYMVNGIPRFILIDPKGYVVDADAPRPSDKSLVKLFDSLGI